MDPMEHMRALVGWIGQHPLWGVLMILIELAWLFGAVLFTRKGST